METFFFFFYFIHFHYSDWVYDSHLINNALLYWGFSAFVVFGCKGLWHNTRYTQSQQGGQSRTLNSLQPECERTSVDTVYVYKSWIGLLLKVTQTNTPAHYILVKPKSKQSLLSDGLLICVYSKQIRPSWIDLNFI